MGILDTAKKMIERPATESELIAAIGRSDCKFVYKNFEAFKNMDFSFNRESKVWFLIAMLKEFCEANDAKAMYEIGQYGIDYMHENNLITNMEDGKGMLCAVEFANQTIIAAYTLKDYVRSVNFLSFYTSDSFVPQTLGHAIALMAAYELQENKDQELQNFTNLAQELYDIYTHEDFFTHLNMRSENECIIAFYDVPRTLATMYMRHQVASVINPNNHLFPLLMSTLVFAEARDKMPKLTPGYEKIRKMIDEALNIFKLEFGEQ